MRVVVVPGIHAEELRRELRTLGLIDRSVLTRRRGADVLIPVRADPRIDLARFNARLMDVELLPIRVRPQDPHEAIEEQIVSAGLPPELAPRRWERIGDVVILRISEAARAHAPAVARAVGDALQARVVVEDVSGIHGSMRLPDIRVLWGDGTETVHVEDRVRFKLDVARVMFSSGNLAERASIARRVGPAEVVVDLFAGIGYFAIPIAAQGPGRTVYACEINTVAFGYLQENLRLNRVSNVVPRLGSCRETAPRGVADWVLMGHFEAVDYLDVAFRALREQGTIVVHGLAPEERIATEPGSRFSAAAASAGVETLEMTVRLIKSYSPRISHFVLEARVKIPPKGLSDRPASGNA